jgi:hypothetical protein
MVDLDFRLTQIEIEPKVDKSLLHNRILNKRDEKHVYWFLKPLRYGQKKGVPLYSNLC